MPDDTTPQYHRNAPENAFRNNAFPLNHIDGQGQWSVRGPNGSEYSVKAYLDTNENIWWYHLDGEKRIAWWKNR